jgi:hypothetical protein
MSGVISDNTVRSSGVVAPLTSATLDANDPTKSTNPTDGVGTKWVNTTSGQIFICIDDTAGANSWIGQEGSNVGTAFMGDRAVWAGGNLTGGGSPTVTNRIQYNTIDSTGNATDYGDLVTAVGGGPVGASGAGRGTFAGGYTAPGNTDDIQYITISSTGNASVLSDLPSQMSGQGASDGVRGWIRHNGTANIYQWTISSTANAIDWADLNYSTNYGLAAGCSLQDRLFYAGGHDGNVTTYDYISYKSTLNNTIAQDFGNLQEAAYQTAGTSDGTKGFILGGHIQSGAVTNKMQVITIATTGNASDWGNMTTINMSQGCCGNTSRCLAAGGGPNGGNDQTNVIMYWNPTLGTGNAVDFGDLIDPVNGPSGLSGD